LRAVGRERDANGVSGTLVAREHELLLRDRSGDDGQRSLESIAEFGVDEFGRQVVPLQEAVYDRVGQPDEQSEHDSRECYECDLIGGTQLAALHASPPVWHGAVCIVHRHPADSPLACQRA